MQVMGLCKQNFCYPTEINPNIRYGDKESTRAHFDKLSSEKPSHIHLAAKTWSSCAKKNDFY